MKRRTRRPFLLLLGALGAATLAAAAWAASLVPPPLRAAIIVRSSGYERGFAERGGDAVLAVVAAKSGPSADDGQAVAAVFQSLLSENKIAGRKVRVLQVTHQTVEKTVEVLKEQDAEIVYFAAGLEDIIKSVPAQSGSTRRILVCADGADVQAGCAIGVELAGERPRLVLNLEQANNAGLRFEPDFLRLARIVR